MDDIIKINLQLFAEGAPAAPTPAPAAEPAPAAQIDPAQAEPAKQEPAAPVGISQRLKDLWEQANAPQQTPQDKADTPGQQAPTQEPPAQEPPAQDNPAEPQAQPEKIMNKYNSVGDLVKAHQSLQTAYNRDHQALLETQRALEQLRTEKAELETRLQTPSQQQPAQSVDELDGLDNEALLEKLMADPKGVITKMAEKIAESMYKPLESKIAPVIEHTEAQKNLDMWNEAVEKFAETNSDMADHLEGMKEYIAANNLQNSKEPQKVLADAYAHAKAKAADAKIAEANAKIAELEARLRTAKEDSIKEHLAGVRNTQNQIPNTIAGSSNSGVPATPPLSLKNKPMSEVHKAAAAYIFGDR